MILARDAISTSALSTVLGYLAQRTNVCAKVIDREGRVLAVNRRGLELLETEAGDVCGQIWAQFWSGADHVAAAGAVECAFGGKPNEFVGTFRSGSHASVWEVEALPLEWDQGQVSKVLLLSTRLVQPGEARDLSAPHPDADFIAKLSETFHALANMTSVTTSSANLLRRGADADRTVLLADALDDAGRRATAAIQELAVLLGKDRR